MDDRRENRLRTRAARESPENMNVLSLDSLLANHEVRGKRVFVRADLNVPISSGRVSDATIDRTMVTDPPQTPTVWAGPGPADRQAARRRWAEPSRRRSERP